MGFLHPVASLSVNYSKIPINFNSEISDPRRPPDTGPIHSSSNMEPAILNTDCHASVKSDIAKLLLSTPVREAGWGRTRQGMGTVLVFPTMFLVA